MNDIDWTHWEAAIWEHGLVIERPRGSRHPRYPDTVYPLDYGYVPQTIGGDYAEVDVFVGTALTGLHAVLVTHDALKGDDEIKLLWNMSNGEVATALAFVNEGAQSGYVVRRAEVVHDTTDADGNPGIHAGEPHLLC
jgi:inorganic pyrophosphatase